MENKLSYGNSQAILPNMVQICGCFCCMYLTFIAVVRLFPTKSLGVNRYAQPLTDSEAQVGLR